MQHTKTVSFWFYPLHSEKEGRKSIMGKRWIFVEKKCIISTSGWQFNKRHYHGFVTLYDTTSMELAGQDHCRGTAKEDETISVTVSSARAVSCGKPRYRCPDSYRPRLVGCQELNQTAEAGERKKLDGWHREFCRPLLVWSRENEHTIRHKTLFIRLHN